MVVARGCCCFLLRRLIQLPALLFCEAMVWAVSFLAFPLRLLTAVDRERKLGRLVGEMQVQMDDLVWGNKELEEKLQAALREHDAMDKLLDEMEDEHDAAFAKIHALETQLEALKQENMRLNEHKGKSIWDKPAAPPARRGHDGSNKASESGKKRPREEEEDAAAAARAPEEAAAEAVVIAAPDPASVLALATSRRTADEQDAAATVARRRSLFSLGMSLGVGAVAWSADAPCLPLLAGLLAVVGVSMCSVSQSCDALRRDGPAADAVALLSLNWFLLGVLTSPMLPCVAHAVVPRSGRVLGPALSWFAAAAPM